jgi:hydroxymethylpyrimidine/phosphomethylpyrimidine kinase
MPKERPCVLSIAGFDPSGGAGALADVKTFEQHKVLGMSVVTGLTFQNDSEFDGVKWIETDEIIKQIQVLTRKFKFEFIKIGMVESLDVLEKIIAICHLPSTNAKIILDPILKASAGFEIHKNFEKEKLLSILKNIFLLTPNTDEINIFTGLNDPMKSAEHLSKYCNVLLKGGHINKAEVRGQTADGKQPTLGKDFLFTTEGKVFPFRPKKISEIGKHGSGCVLSSAIAANLANGNDLQRSCLKGKDYVTKFLTSNKTLLGYHKS